MWKNLDTSNSRYYKGLCYLKRDWFIDEYTQQHYCSTLVHQEQDFGDSNVRFQEIMLTNILLIMKKSYLPIKPTHRQIDGQTDEHVYYGVA